MIVPNYIPDPMEVPGNVTQEPYRFRVAYIRRVTLLHLATLGFVGLLTQYAWPQVGPLASAGMLGIVLVVLDFWRIAARSSRTEAVVSAAFLPTVVAFVAWTATEVNRLGWPAWAPLAGVVAATLYTTLCGRDFSFVGCIVLSWIASSVAIAAMVPPLGMDARHAAAALVANTVYLIYFQYDLASLLSRRRRGEEWAAVVDLYRDVFNVFGYFVRCVRHWRKHRIWEIAR
ncbi:MAG: hypothetical protein ACO1SV_14320 [Fimbriimonas sp.]